MYMYMYMYVSLNMYVQYEGVPLTIKLIESPRMVKTCQECEVLSGFPAKTRPALPLRGTISWSTGVPAMWEIEEVPQAVMGLYMLTETDTPLLL